MLSTKLQAKKEHGPRSAATACKHRQKAQGHIFGDGRGLGAVCLKIAMGLVACGVGDGADGEERHPIYIAYMGDGGGLHIHPKGGVPLGDGLAHIILDEAVAGGHWAKMHRPIPLASGAGRF